MGVYTGREACAHKLSASLQRGLLFYLVTKNFYTPSLLLRNCCEAVLLRSWNACASVRPLCLAVFQINKSSPRDEKLMIVRKDDAARRWWLTEWSWRPNLKVQCSRPKWFRREVTGLQKATRFRLVNKELLGCTIMEHLSYVLTVRESERLSDLIPCSQHDTPLKIRLKYHLRRRINTQAHFKALIVGSLTIIKLPLTHIILQLFYLSAPMCSCLQVIRCIQGLF